MEAHHRLPLVATLDEESEFRVWESALTGPSVLDGRDGGVHRIHRSFVEDCCGLYWVDGRRRQEVGGMPFASTTAGLCVEYGSFIILFDVFFHGRSWYVEEAMHIDHGCEDLQAVSLVRVGDTSVLLFVGVYDMAAFDVTGHKARKVDLQNGYGSLGPAAFLFVPEDEPLLELFHTILPKKASIIEKKIKEQNREAAAARAFVAVGLPSGAISLQTIRIVEVEGGSHSAERTILDETEAVFSETAMSLDVTRDTVVAVGTIRTHTSVTRKCFVYSLSARTGGLSYRASFVVGRGTIEKEWDDFASKVTFWGSSSPTFVIAVQVPNALELYAFDDNESKEGEAWKTMRRLNWKQIGRPYGVASLEVTADVAINESGIVFVASGPSLISLPEMLTALDSGYEARSIGVHEGALGEALQDIKYLTSLEPVTMARKMLRDAIGRPYYAPKQLRIALNAGMLYLVSDTLHFLLDRLRASCGSSGFLQEQQKLHEEGEEERGRRNKYQKLVHGVGMLPASSFLHNKPMKATRPKEEVESAASLMSAPRQFNSLAEASEGQTEEMGGFISASEAKELKAYLREYRLPFLSEADQEELSNVVEVVAEFSHVGSTVDDAGVNYLVASRLSHGTVNDSDALWGAFSETQEAIMAELKVTAPDWDQLRRLGVGYWVSCAYRRVDHVL